MTEIGQIEEIVKQYARHGWILRRVLLSASLKEAVPPDSFGDAEVKTAELNALWFARASANGGEAWELRNLSAVPFALVEVFDGDDEEEVRDETRREMETQMKERASKPVARTRES